MSIRIEDQRVIAQIVGTFARKPKTHIEHIGIYESRENDGSQVARVLFYDGRQRRYGEHKCCVNFSFLEGSAYMRFFCCQTQKTVKVKLKVTADQPSATKQ